MGLGDMAKKAKDALTSDTGERGDDQPSRSGTGSGNPGPATEEHVGDERRAGGSDADANPGPGTDGVNAVGTTGGSEKTSGTTTAGATSPGPDSTETGGRHRADGTPDAADGSKNPGPRKPGV